MSGDPEQDYFADGMVEEIITALSRVKWFFVIARNSTFTYKGRAVDVKQVARELGVRYVLEGSVRKAGNRVRITGQLIDAATGNHIWAERYDRELADIFAVQDEITQSVVGAIEPQLYAAESLRVQSKAPESLDAWGCVIRALSHLSRITAEDTEQAKQLLNRAIALSPTYAKAHSLLARAELFAVRTGGSDMETALPVAKQHAQRALILDDTDPWSHLGTAIVETFQGRYAEAIPSFHRAIDLNPNSAVAHGFMAGALALSGQADAALDAVHQAMRLSPQDHFNSFYLYFAAVAHYTAERYTEALTCLNRALRERPNHFSCRRLQAACYAGLGRLEEARTAISEVLRLQPNSSIKRDAYGWGALARGSDQERYVSALRRAGLPEE
jgi:adenylate cyclase